MKAKQFKEVNAVYGENQPEYYPLPAYKSEDGTAVFCQLILIIRVHIVYRANPAAFIAITVFI